MIAYNLWDRSHTAPQSTSWMNFFLFFVFFRNNICIYNTVWVFEELSPKSIAATCVPRTCTHGPVQCKLMWTATMHTSRRREEQQKLKRERLHVVVCMISCENDSLAQYTKSACNWTSAYSMRLTSNGESSKSRAKEKYTHESSRRNRKKSSNRQSTQNKTSSKEKFTSHISVSPIGVLS